MSMNSHVFTSSISSYTESSSSLNTLSGVQARSLNISHCLAVNFSVFQFHDVSKGVMSTQTSNILNNVIHAVLFPALFFIGFPSNIVNMVVFFKHGLKQRINLCLFCLSLVDLIFVTIASVVYFEKFQDLNFNISYRNVGRIMEMLINNRVVGFYSGSGLASQFISAVIAGERCMCVVWPLRSAGMLTTKSIGVVLLVGIVLIFAGRLVAGMKYRVVCLVDLGTRLTSYHVSTSEFYRRNKELIIILDGLVFGVGLPVIFCIFVIITTSITAANLKRSTEFQKESSVSTAGAQSSRNIAVTRMLIYLSMQFIILNAPNALFRLSLVFLPQFSPSGDWANLYFFLFAIVELFCILNSSLNFLVYYFFGSKYRETVRQVMCKFMQVDSKRVA